MFNLDIGNDLGISCKCYGFGLKGQRSTLGLTAITQPLQLSELVSDLQHPVQSQCHELGRRLVTGHSRQPALVHGTNCHHRFVAFLLLLLLNVNSRHFYSITLLTNTVRRLVVSALTSPWSWLFRQIDTTWVRTLWVPAGFYIWVRMLLTCWAGSQCHEWTAVCQEERW